ncbi:MAG TPA: MASE1 domain-containing protein, partial [Acetobacteraceae bacterium]|nr:MASE1 domain-containing protein [Acetobacteraceae bacterium]
MRRIPAGAGRHVALALACASGYFVLARIGYAFMIQPAGVAIWPAGGAMFACLVLLDRRYWAGALAGAFAGNVAADISRHAALTTAAAGSAVNALEALVAAVGLVCLAGRAI